MLILELQGKQHNTLFAKLKDIYPECMFLIEDEVQLHPLICLKSTCHRGFNCMEKLAKRITYIFDEFKKAQLLLLYFSYRDRPKSQRAGVFWRDMREPRYITMNPYAWNLVKEKAVVYDWHLPSSILS